MRACDDCLRRAWLLAAMSGHLDAGRRRPEALALPDDELIASFGGAAAPALRREHRGFAPHAAREAVSTAGLTACCRHDPAYPACLIELTDPPAALFVAGRPEALLALSDAEEPAPAVAVVGARRSAGEGEEVAAALGHGLAAAGVCVVSGMALGIDSAAHRGALAAPRPAGLGAPTIAVLAGGADVVYPPSGRQLHGRIVAAGCAISEMPPGTQPRRWSFPARNRIIAALGQMTVVVQARIRSGSLITADLAMQLGRGVGAVPGAVTRPLSEGTNALLADGAHVVRDASDVLDAVVPGWRARSRAEAAPPRDLDPELQAVLTAVADGACTAGQVAELIGAPDRAAAALSRLELLGLLRRDPAGRYARAALL